jgi:hypothetical protein
MGGYLDLAKRLISQGRTLSSREKSGPKHGKNIQAEQGVTAEPGGAAPLISLISPLSIGGSGKETSKVDQPTLEFNPSSVTPASAETRGSEISEESEKRPSAWVSAANRARDDCEISPAPQPDWTDDRAWILEIQRAPDLSTKLEVLAAWVAVVGGEIVDGMALLPALRPPRERRLAELELRRMVRQLGLEILEDEAGQPTGDAAEGWRP